MESTLRYQTKLKLLEYEEYGVSKCKEFEKMELSKNQSSKYRLENEITIPEFMLKNMITEFEEVEVQEKLDKMRLDVDISITKGENILSKQ